MNVTATANRSPHDNRSEMARREPTLPAFEDRGEDRPAELFFYRGRVALFAILKALGVGTGDEVILQGFTCVAVPEGVLATGATPVYADIEPDGYNLSPESCRSLLSPKTRAIVVQHTFGIPAKIARIRQLADEAGIPVVEDCCHAIGARVAGRELGGFGVASFYSFEWGKQIVAGLGGSAVANEPELQKRLLELHAPLGVPPLIKRSQLMVQHTAFQVLNRPAWYWKVRAAYHGLARLGIAAGNFRPAGDLAKASPEYGWQMPRAAVRRVQRQSKQIEATVKHSRQVASQYRCNIATPEVLHPVISPEETPSYARYPLRVEAKQELLKQAEEKRVELAGWYQSVIHPLTSETLSEVGYEPGCCPNAEQRASEVVSLPTNSRVTAGSLERTISLLNGLR